MSGGFTAIELDKLPVPDVIETIDYETILGELTADLIARDPDMEDTLALESEPALKILQVAAYRETLLRQRINEAAKAVMLAYAQDSDLDNLGAFYEVERLLLDAGDPDALPPIAATYESNEDYRRRIQLSLEGFSTAGPEGAYVFHALSADGQVLDASATSPSPGEVLVSVLSRVGDGIADTDLLTAVETTLSDEDVRPLTDHVQVQSAEIIGYQVIGTLYFYSGPDRTVVMQTAQDALNTYVANQHRMGRDVSLSGIYAALHQPGVQRVELDAPTGDITVTRLQAPYCTAIDLTDGGIDE